MEASTRSGRRAGGKLGGVAVIRLHLSDTHPDPTLPWADGDTSVYAYLIDHPDGLILVDTGVGEGSALIDALYHPDHHDLAEAIERTGHHIGDGRTVINSHLHFDHCGHNHLFPSVPILVQRREYQAVHHGSYTVEEWVDFPGARIQQLDGDHQVAPGVRVVSTPGHTTGHQSVVVDDSEGRTVICAQAAYTAADFGSGRTDPHSTEAADVQLASIDRLRSLRPDRVCFSNDATDSDAGCSGVVSATSRPGLAWPKAGLAWPKARLA